MILKQSKIDFLVNLIFILFFPYLVFASFQTQLSNTLHNYGFTLTEMGKMSVLLPKGEVAVKINNLSQLQKGFNKAKITIFYHKAFYANADINIRLKQKDILPSKKTKDYSLITKGKPVDVVYKTGNLIIRLKGELLESKTVNSFVKVKITKLNKIVDGVLIDKNTVLMP